MPARIAPGFAQGDFGEEKVSDYGFGRAFGVGLPVASNFRPNENDSALGRVVSFVTSRRMLGGLGVIHTTINFTECQLSILRSGLRPQPSDE